MKKLLALLMVVLLVSTGFAAEIAETESAGAVPAASVKSEPKKMISVDFPDTPLSTVLDVMSIKTGRKFITDSELAKKRIIMNLKDVSADEALDALLDAYNLYYVRQNETSNIYVIKPRPTNTPVTTVSKIIFLNFASVKNMEPVVKSKLTPNGTVVAEEYSNSMIINDVADNLDKIAALIKTLDIPSLQVLLEAKIIDVKIDSDNEFGVNINNLYRTGKYWTSPLELYRSSVFKDYTVPVSAVQPEVNFMQSFAPGLTNSGQLRVSILNNNDYSLEAIIEAMQKNGNARLLNNPRLLVMNNNEASIDIVDQIPYEERSITQGTTNITVSFKDVGIKLKVRPQISRDGTIVLNVVPENSYEIGKFLNYPVINVSKSNTTFIMRDGETAVIGGLIRETEQKTEYKLPLLGDIPLLGFLFKKYSKTKSRSELTIFITAKVMQ